MVKKIRHSQWCSAINCNNSRVKKPDLALFRFPKDPERCKRWLNEVRRADLDDKSPEALCKGNVLCEDHFPLYAFSQKARKKKFLRRGAIPTLFNFPEEPEGPELFKLEEELGESEEQGEVKSHCQQPTNEPLLIDSNPELFVFPEVSSNFFEPSQKRSFRKKLTAQEKQEICQYCNQWPTKNQGQITNHFSSLWQKAISRRTICDILQNKEKWLTEIKKPGKKKIKTVKPETMNIKTVLIDLSGTLHVEDQVTPGALEALQRLQEVKDLNIKFVTNTTKECKAVLIQRLLRIGFSVAESHVFTSLTAARKIIDNDNLRPFLLVDDRALADFEGVCQDDPNAVVIGLAPDKMNYANLDIAFRLLLSGARQIAIHKAKYYQRGDGLSLGPGAFVSALEFSSNVKAEVVGKPNKSFFLSSIAELDCRPEECIMIGDDVSDDVDGAQTVGMRGILVKTGKYRAGDETKISPQPFLVCENFSMAVDYILSLLLQ